MSARALHARFDCRTVRVGVVIVGYIVINSNISAAIEPDVYQSQTAKSGTTLRLLLQISEAIMARFKIFLYYMYVYINFRLIH